MGFSARVFAFVAVCILVASCSTLRLDENLSDYSRDVSRLRRQLLEDPQADGAMRDLGAIYMRTGNVVEANDHLQNAYSLGNRDPKTLFYLGLVNEHLGKTQTAIRLYEGYTDVSQLSPYRSLMQGRYAWLVREAARSELQKRLADEAGISDSEILSDVVAVFPLTYLGSDARYDPIGRGLSEMMTIDLQGVGQIRVVERTRLQVLLNELDLSTTDRVDQSTAPRLGRLLRAGKIVGGTYNVLSGNDLRLDAAFVETISSELNDLPSQTDALANFFRLEKQLVFSLLDELGVELTESEQAQIQQIPTQNLQAFLAFSRGLIQEDQLNFEAAARSFQEASSIDPSFTISSVRGERAQSLGDASGASLDLLQNAMLIEPNFGPGIDLMSNRIGHLSSGIGSAMLPGPDSRNPAEEASIAGVTEGELLPPPPPPPGRN